MLMMLPCGCFKRATQGLFRLQGCIGHMCSMLMSQILLWLKRPTAAKMPVGRIVVHLENLCIVARVQCILRQLCFAIHFAVNRPDAST